VGWTTVTASLATVPDGMDDVVHKLLKKLLATEDVAEFDALSLQLRSLLHERIEELRKEAKSLKPKSKIPDRRKAPRNGATKP